MTGTLIHTRARAQKVFGFAGFSGSGKTTLLVNLIPELTNRGLSVSTIKHAHHGFDIDEAEVVYWGTCPACTTARP